MNPAPPQSVNDAERLAPSPEKEWVEQAKKGDEEAYKKLFEAYFPKLYGTIYQMVQNAATAEDLTQGAMIQAWRRLHQFDGRSAFGTWLYRIGVNLTLDHLRRLKNRPQASLDAALEEGMEPAGESAHPSAGLEQNEFARTFKDALACLSESHRMVFVLGEIEGKDYEEIGQLLGCKRGTVMSRMHYARLHLQKLLRPYYERQR